MTARITACICTYDRYDLLPKAIASCSRQSLPAALYKIVVVDNSPDAAKAHAFAERLRAAGTREGVEIDYRIEPVPGLSNARNVGAAVCDTEFIAFIDDDAIAEAHWLERLLEAFDEYGTNASVVGGRVDPLWESPRPGWLHDRMIGFVSVVNWGGQTRRTSVEEWLGGTNIAFRTAALLDFGGFDVHLGRIGDGGTLLSNEETAMLRDFRARGADIVYVPESAVWHLVAAYRCTQDWFRKRAAWQAVSDFIMSPAECRVRAKSEWWEVLEYFFALPPALRNVRGFRVPTEDPLQFHRQLRALEVFTLASLTGFEAAAQVDIASARAVAA